jgi:hypothetical protein
MSRLLPLALLLAACSDSACPEGSFQTAGGDCVEGDIGTLAWEDGVIDGIQTRQCELKEANGDLDLVNACALGGCVGDTYETLIDTWGSGTTCNDFSYTINGERRDRVGCDWANGLGMHFDASGNNPDLTDAGDVFSVESPFRGATVDGLGIGVSMGCFAARYGQPDDMDFDNDGPQEIPYKVSFRKDEAHVVLYDGWLFDDGARDGIVDYMLILPVN